jgi:ABC-type oligopeptide transport system substrate-binding subunit
MRYSKFLFTIVLVLIIGLGASLLKQDRRHFMQGKEKESREITAVLTGRLTLPLGPENISTIPLFQLHLNLWASLVSEHGEAALAQLASVEDHGKKFTFEILPNARFSNGRKITADDIQFSLNRIMHKQPGGHFNAKGLIESVTPLSVSRVEIRLREPASAFLYLLSIPEMGIVPKEACNQDGDIVSLNVTSGGYSVDGVSGEDRITLKRNPFFERSDSRSPERVTVLFRRDLEPLVQAADRDHADFFEFYEGNGIKAFEALKDRQEFSYKTTRPSFSIFLIANPETLSRDQRQGIGSVLLTNFDYSLNPTLEKRSFEILPPGTFGSLELKAYPLPSVSEPKLPKSVKLASFDSNAPLVQAVAEKLRLAGVDVRFVRFGQESFDVALIGQGMNDDYPEIEFYLNMVSPFAPIKASEAEKSEIMTALHSTDRKQRSESLRSVGRALLEDARIIPLLVRSYAHLYRKNKINIDDVTTYDGNVPFWEMRVN